jgi:membrane-bound serine protease (ClpP class)
LSLLNLNGDKIMWIKRIKIVCCFLLAWPLISFAAQKEILKIVIDGDINPVSAKFITENIDYAETHDFECLLIQMDTPGGLLESTKSIVKKILNAQIPVIMYVAPSGAGATSAGVFITMACHVAAMAEGTTIGAAHPVGIGQQDTSKIMSEKVTNYASSWMRTIADKRGRNVSWAEKAVRESVSVTEKEALKLKVIDVISPTQNDLLEKLNGRSFEFDNGIRVLDTTDAKIITFEMNWQRKILYKISNPNIAYILMMLGIFGLIFELSNPGAIVPGVVGGVFLILALFAMATLPVRAAGLLLIVFAIVLFILEVKVTSYGVLTIGGIVSMFLGSIMLFEQVPGFAFRVDWKVALTFALATAAFFMFALGMALKARLSKPTTGREGLLGFHGSALTALQPDGQVQVRGEIWQAIADKNIAKGEKIQVIQVEGLILKVEKFKI